jgi:hypothetical protein
MAFTNMTPKYERDGRIARITLNRPDRPNAIDERMPRGMLAAVEDASRDDSPQVIVPAGAAGVFSAGDDLEPHGRRHRLLHGPVAQPQAGDREGARLRDRRGHRRRAVLRPGSGAPIGAPRAQRTLAASSAIPISLMIRTTGMPSVQVSSNTVQSVPASGGT